MPTSEARIAANRRNALLSRGPTTPEGKARSRANSYKHGMTGAGVVLPPEEAAEIDRQAAEIRRTVAVPALARRVAVLASRLDRLAIHDEAASARRVRDAVSDAREERQQEVDAWTELLADESRVAVRNLRRTPEGAERLIGLWEDLAGDLAAGVFWSEAHQGRAENLLGRRPGDLGSSRAGILSTAAQGKFDLIPSDPTAYEPGRLRARREQARADLAALIAGEVDRLRAHQATFPDLGPEAEQAEAADLALFDTTKQGELFRRYELATERGLYRALREIERPCPEAPAVEEAPSPVGLGSFGSEPAADPTPPAAGPPPASPEIGMARGTPGQATAPPLRPAPITDWARERAELRAEIAQALALAAESAVPESGRG
jgi:hypothetical protein